jgi:hypothetical protein
MKEGIRLETGSEAELFLLRKKDVQACLLFS